MHAILAARSNFSIGESINDIGKLVKQAAELGSKAIALTDTMSVTGLPELTTKAKAAGIKPIIGARLRLVDDITWRKTKDDKKAPAEFFVTYYVLSGAGLMGLYKLLSLANDEDHFYNNAKLSFADLYSVLDTLTADDVAIASSDAYSVGTHADAQSILQRIADAVTRENVFLTLTPIHTPYWDTVNTRAIELANTLGLPLLTTIPSLYPEGGADATDVMNAIRRNVKMDEPWAYINAARDMHPRSLKGLVELCKESQRRLVEFRGVKGAGGAFLQGLKNTETLVSKVTYEWQKFAPSLPVMAPDEFAAVVTECKKGWSKRFGAQVFGHRPSLDELKEVYTPRLKYELSVLKNLKFCGYFLLVQDVVQFAKGAGIAVGPGRGSVGGSLIAYLMGITDCDPIRFGLLFERFINPERLDLPDADLDFMSARRHEVFTYLINKYGAKRVAGVSNFLKLGASSAIRGVSKSFRLPEDDYRCSKFVPKKHGQPVKLVEAIKEVPEIADWASKNPFLAKTAGELEGCMSALGQHAAGVVVAGCDLVERAVIERRKAPAKPKEGEEEVPELPVVCWDKRIVEDQGLVKMDILGLNTLDLIEATRDYIRKRRGKTVDLLRIPLDDPKVLENFAKAISTGIFQFEGGGMRRLLKELGKDGTICFDDITAATALYRPGPMESGMMDSYWKRKQGIEEVEYDHPLMEPILKPTFGVMVYQEQVMQISQVIAGYTGPQADKLRKIMGKKLPEEMAKERGKFVQGCVDTVKQDANWAGALFDKIEGFAGYGFNKSHSVEYTLISYQAMYLKTYYAVEFFAAALSQMGQDKLPGLMKDAERMGIEVDLPDINHSTGQFEIVTDARLCMPFNRIKGISANTTDAILKARAAGPFKSMQDLTDRVERRRCNVRHVETLNKVGAFARIEPGQLPAKHDSRVKDQRELLPGLITAHVPIAREMDIGSFEKAKIITLVADYCDGHHDDGMPVKPTIGRKARFMVITDCPAKGEDESGFMSFLGSKTGGTMNEWIKAALDAADLQRQDAYWTALIKRPKEGKQVSPKEITAYSPYLMKEIEILKPPCIVLLGSSTVRHFIPDFKGKASEFAGEVVYSKALDANLVIGFAPGEIFFEPAKQAKLDEVFAVAASLTE
ncbi:DNA polymerase III subunit alpha [Methylobacterium sp. AMS5]|uniref:DNA polymerase III subunit alpha n=1 Tax=Methylobacterium sp. AMS5 TaxID=925818 RepID=UPI00074F8695|nr:DNA polymerase III subunit alpha [Methylobacterium sp. AMS5]AMB48372.1 DNA polymerase III [Methylobacterium sp. AMS5]